MNFLIDTWEKLYQFWVDGWLWIFEQILTAFVTILELIPVPTWAQNIGSFPVPDGVMFFVNVFELPYGVSVMTSAWTIRFIVRRLPVVG